MFEYFVVFVVLGLFSGFYLKLAEKFNIYDTPNDRSSHKKPVIRGLGILFWFSALLFFITSEFQSLYVFTGLSIIGIISFIDDIRPLIWWGRLFFHMVGIALILFELNVFESNELFFVLIILITGVLSINFYNFMDGINGLLFLNALITLVALFVLNFNHPVFDQNLVVYPFIAVLIFGYFNFRKDAVAFSGDVGSVFLGGLFFYLTVLLVFKTKSPIILLLLAIQFVDAGCTLLYRLLKGKNIFNPHREHLYEKLVDLGCSYRLVSICYAFVQICVSFIIVRFNDSILKIQIVIIFLVLSFLLFLYFSIFKIIATKNLKK